jgi:ATP-dependent 26S proteasome regulatory subunit
MITQAVNIYKAVKTFIEDSHFLKRKQVVYKIIGKVSYKANVIYFYDISVQLKAVLHDLITKLADQKNIDYSIEEICMGGANKEVLRFVNFTRKNFSLDIAPDVQLKTMIKEENSAKEDNKYVTFTITLVSKKYIMQDLLEYIEDCTTRYNSFKLYQLKQQHIFIFDSVKKDTQTLEYQEIKFDTTKSFDNMFFEQKQDLIDRLDYFRDHEEEYRRLGIPHTFGMLFHGSPGCGKTSCIKAVAKHTNRHIIILPVKKIRSIELLKKIFLSQQINNTHIPNDKRLYVFEEIDCGQWRNVVMNRNLKETEEKARAHEGQNPTHMAKEIIDMVSKVVVSDCKNEEQDNSLNLGELLELLDGIIEVPGRMMILTSNHPEILDPALLRPGRVDKTIEFKKMTREDIINMYRLWFKREFPKEIVPHLRDYMFSQAEIGMIFSTHDMENIHETLKNCAHK